MPEVCKEIHLVGAEEVQALFGKTFLTILSWRKKRGLPYVVVHGGKRPAIRYDLKRVIAWAKKEDIEFDEGQLKHSRSAA